MSGAQASPASLRLNCLDPTGQRQPVLQTPDALGGEEKVGGSGLQLPLVGSPGL